MLYNSQDKGLVGVVVGHSILFAIVAMIVTNFDGAKNQVISGWVQAIGSVLGIFFAIYVSNAQHQRQEVSLKKERLEQYIKLCGYAVYVCASMAEVLNYLRGEKVGQLNYDRHLRLLEDSLRLVNSIDMNSIYSAELTMQWVQIGHNLSDFVGHMKECPIDLVKIRLSNFERCVGRADSNRDEIKKMVSEFEGL